MNHHHHYRRDHHCFHHHHYRRLSYSHYLDYRHCQHHYYYYRQKQLQHGSPLRRCRCCRCRSLHCIFALQCIGVRIHLFDGKWRVNNLLSLSLCHSLSLNFIRILLLHPLFCSTLLATQHGCIPSLFMVNGCICFTFHSRSISRSRSPSFFVETITSVVLWAVLLTPF